MADGHLLAVWKGEENYFRDRTYFLKRMATKALDRKLENPKIRYLYFRDGQKCAYCKSQIEDNQFDIHHLNSREDNKWENQLLLHRNCHRTLHAKKERITRLSDGIYNVHQA